MEQQHYWNLIKWDGETIEVRPEAVTAIRNLLSKGEGFIPTPTRDIAVKDVKDFVETGKPYTDQKLLERGVQAFAKPEYNEDGSIITRWVKKPVPKREWLRYYAPIGYRKLEEHESGVWIAFRLPTYIANKNLYDCNPVEIGHLERGR
jgi:hypothetical protein